MFTDKSIEELASETMYYSSMDDEKRLLLIEGLAQHGINVNPPALALICTKKFQDIVDFFNKRADAFTDEDYIRFKEAFNELNLADILDKFVMNYMAGKYKDADIEKLHMIVEKKAPEQFSIKQLKNFVLAEVMKSQLSKLSGRVEALLEKEEGVQPIEAVTLVFFGDTTYEFNLFMRVLKKINIAESLAEAEKIVVGRIKELEADIFEQELMQEETASAFTQNRMDSLSKASQAIASALKNESSAVTTRPQRVTQNSKESCVSANSSVTFPVDIGEDGKPQIGGWLTLMGIGMVIGPLRAIASVYQGYQGLSEYPSSLKLWSFFALGCDTFLTLFIIYAATAFFSKSKEFPKIYRNFFISSLILYTLVVVALGMHRFVRASDLGTFVGELLAGIIASGIWLIYLYRSKRAKATFVS